MIRHLLLAALLAALMAKGVQCMNMGGGIQPSVNATGGCYDDPTKPECKTFRRQMSEWMSDMRSLCMAMDFMPGCDYWRSCNATLIQKNPKTNMTIASGTYCGMPSLVGDICCESMGRMKGCEAYLRLCGNCGKNATVVDLCKTTSPMPNFLWTWEVKEDVDKICNSTTGLEPCSRCTSKGKDMSGCPHPTVVLAGLCFNRLWPLESPECRNITAMCATPAVRSLMPDLCHVPNKPCPHPHYPISTWDKRGRRICTSCQSIGLGCGKRSCNADGCTACPTGYHLFLGAKNTSDAALYQPIPRGAPKLLSQCVSCESKYGAGCSVCTKNKCHGCRVGYSPNGLGTCMKCKDRNCVECLPNPYVCSKCTWGMRVVRGTCRARYHW